MSLAFMTPAFTQSPSQRAEALADAWEQAASGPLWHPSTCACGAGMGMPVLNASDAGLDLIDFLAARAALEKDEAVRAVITPLTANNGESSPALGDWLRALPAARLPQASLDRLLDRIENFIDSLRPPGSGGRFVCT
jgi:hypothetical protein